MLAPSASTNTAPQLGLPFDVDVMHTWTDSGASPLQFTVTLTPRGARLRLVGPWPADEPDGAPPLQGLLWHAEVDLAHPGRTHIAPPPEASHLPRSRAARFTANLPVADCLFTAPLAWAAEVGQRQGAEVDRLLLAMRRSLVLVARHLARVSARGPGRRGWAKEGCPPPQQCCLWAAAG